MRFNFSNVLDLSNRLLRWALVALVVFLFLFILSRIKRKNIGKMDDSALAYGEKKRIHGILFGQAIEGGHAGKMCYSPQKEEGHILVNGGSGTGKTAGIFIPTLKTWRGAGAYLDVSGDIIINCPDIPNKIVFDLEDPESPPYNVFAPIDSLEDEEEIYEALEKIAYLMIPVILTASQSENYFRNGGRDIVIASLFSFYFVGYDFCDIAQTVCASTKDELFAEIMRIDNYRAVVLIKPMLEENEANVSGCKKNANDAFKLFATNTKIKRCVRRGRDGERQITARQAGSCNIFFHIKHAKLDQYAALIRIIFTQILDYFSVRPESETKQALLGIDEFAAFGKLDITNALRMYRKKHVRIMIITQSINDIFTLYGHDETKSMLNNFKFKACLSASDVETQRFFADLIGQEYVEHTTYTRGSYFFSRRESTVSSSGAWEYSIRPEDLDRLGDDLILLYPGGWKKLHIAYYFGKKKRRRRNGNDIGDE